jgi:putative endonuclease
MPYVYVMSNASMTLYTGSTTVLRDRVQAHKDGSGASFTSRYHFDRVVFVETFETLPEAVARERQLKRWSRGKKIALIKKMNPAWRDLAGDF